MRLGDAARAWAQDAARAATPDAPVLVLTGAGISAASGIPTFRGPEGYWRVGSRNYRPEELATRAAFEAMPDEVWSWYLYRRGVCRRAAPNEAHHALAALEERLGTRFRLVTQNVDGLHARAGHDPARLYAIHGSIDLMRPVGGGAVVPIPEAVPIDWPKTRALGPAERALLVHEGERTRPHVLWFDESYDEAHFRFESTLRAAAAACLVMVVGTSGATTLPLHVGRLAAQRGTPLLVVNPEPNPFVAMLEAGAPGAFVQGTATEAVPALCTLLGGG
ncbi:MAG: Sir2 family NAD-dependent protein deacetylase [Myxococcota bacterium]